MNPIIEKMAAGEAALGLFMNCSYAAFTEIAGRAGFDYAIADTEHGPLSIETAEDLCRAGQCGGLAPIVRVRENEPTLIQRALDIGSAGVQVPQISTAADAERAVHSAKYWPYGQRGFSPATRAGDYFLSGSVGLTDRLNEEQMLIVHIEGKEGVDNLDAILAVPHIDVIFLGPYDLSQSLGIPGQVNDPLITSTMIDAAHRIREAGKFAGTFCGTAESAQFWYRQGIQYLTMGVDIALFGNACRNLVNEVRAGL